MRKLVYKFNNTETDEIVYVNTYMECLKLIANKDKNSMKYTGLELIEIENPKDKEL